jgi:hypothetical protein
VQDKQEKAKVKPVGKMRSWFIRGEVRTTSVYQKVTKKGTTKYEKKYHDILPYAKRIEARTKEEALNQYRAMAADDLNMEGYAKTTEVDDIFIDDIKDEGAFKARGEANSLMRDALPVDYEFIPDEKSLLKHTGECVVDQFVGVYGPLIKKLTKQSFVDLCYEFNGTSKLDRGIIDDETGETVWS